MTEIVTKKISSRPHRRKPSKRLQQIADADPRIDEYEFDPSNDMGAHWLHLAYPLVAPHGGGSIHEDSVAACLAELKQIQN